MLASLIYFLYFGILYAQSPISLSYTIFDFLNCDSPGGHPDFDCFTGNVPTTGLVSSTLGGDGKPVFASTGGVMTSSSTFAQWFNNVPGTNKNATQTLTLNYTNGYYNFSSNAFFPIDGQLYGNEMFDHNYGFCVVLHTTYTHKAGLIIDFAGDDDLWVFINSILVIDLGGPHPIASASLQLDKLNIGLVVGQNYPFDLFYCERHTYDSDLVFGTNIVFSSCGTTDTDGDGAYDGCDYCYNDPILTSPNPPPAGWTCFTPIPVGYYTEGPAIVTLTSTSGMYFSRGVGAQSLFYRLFDGSTVTPSGYWYEDTEPTFTMASRPSAVFTTTTTTTGRVDVVTRGTNTSIYWKTFQITAISPITLGTISNWACIGGYGVGAPVISSCGANNLIVLVRGSDSTMWWNNYSGTSWSGFKLVGSLVLDSDPTVSFDTANPGYGIDVFAKSNGNLYQITYDVTNGWTTWSPWGITLDNNENPHISQSGSSYLDFIANSVYGMQHWAYVWQNGLGWTKPVNIGGIFSFEPAIASFGVEHVRVVVVWNDVMYWRDYTGTNINGPYIEEEEKSTRLFGISTNVVVFGVSVGCALFVVAVVLLVVFIKKYKAPIENESLSEKLSYSLQE